MFMSLLIATFCISLVVSTLVVLFFGKPIKKILQRIIADDIYKAWGKYMKFAIYITGISSGVRIRALEKYITERTYEGAQIIELTRDRWVLEIYRTVVETLQGVAWMLLVFFVFALIAYVIVRAFELKKHAKADENC